MDQISCPDKTCVCWLLKSFYPEKAGNRISGGTASGPAPAPRIKAGTVEIRTVGDAAILFPRADISSISSSLAFPTPVDMYRKSVKSFALRDGPRFVPSGEGAIPCDEEGRAGKCDAALLNTSGFDVRNDANDAFIFLPGSVGGSSSGGGGDGIDVASTTTKTYGYAELRAEYLLLTGAIPALPDEAFGTWFSWYHAYNQSGAESDIARWRDDDLPIDIWGLDMDWRIWAGGMEGKEYKVNTKLFPNMTAFYEFAHQHDLVVYMNDHPMANATQLSPQEIKFRFDGLTSLFDLGLDFWWYDENWHNIIPGIDGFPNGGSVDHLVWGQEIFRSVAAHYNRVNGPRVRAPPPPPPPPGGGGGGG